MAITDNNFTADEFKAAVTANADLMNIIKGTLTEQKYVLHSETEHTEYLKNFEANAISKKTNEFASNLERDVLELTGVPKASADEKYYDYLKRSFSEKLSSVANLEKEIKELKAKGPNEADKARIKTLEEAIAAKETEWQSKLSEKDNEINNIRKSGEIDKVLGEIRAKYKPNIPSSIIAMAEKQIVSTLLQSSKFQEDGALTIIGSDGNVMLNKQTYKPVTADEYIREQLKDLIDTGKKQAGSGTNPDDVGGKGSGSEGKFDGVPPTVKTKVQLSEHLLKLGYTTSQKEFDEILAEHGKALPLR